MPMFRLPTTATAPFCPSEVQGSVHVAPGTPFWRKLLLFAGPGLLVSVGYMDPGNWATDIEAGSRYGYGLLFVVALSSLAAMVLQCLSVKLGLVTGKDLARNCREQLSKRSALSLWGLAELAIIATDLAEVLGSALAFHLLLGCSLLTGVGLTALDTFIVLGLQGKGFRRVEAIVLGLISTIGACYAVELWLIGPDWSAAASGLWPSLELMSKPEPWYLAIGILGATVMPHNLYLHSSIVLTRETARTPAGLRSALRWASTDTIVSLSLAFIVNAAILILAASAFHATGQTVTEIDTAYRLLEPIVGTTFASVAFGIALLAAGQSSTFTGTIAGQVMMEGFLELKFPCYIRRLITRGLALVPALVGVWWLGEHATGRLLVLSQVVLSLQLPFAIYPLLRFTNNRELMGAHANGLSLRAVGWLLFGAISAANLWLVIQFVL